MVYTMHQHLKQHSEIFFFSRFRLLWAKCKCTALKTKLQPRTFAVPYSFPVKSKHNSATTYHINVLGISFTSNSCIPLSLKTHHAGIGLFCRWGKKIIFFYMRSKLEKFLGRSSSEDYEMCG